MSLRALSAGGDTSLSHGKLTFFFYRLDPFRRASSIQNVRNAALRSHAE